MRNRAGLWFLFHRFSDSFFQLLFIGESSFNPRNLLFCSVQDDTQVIRSVLTLRNVINLP